MGDTKVLLKSWQCKCHQCVVELAELRVVPAGRDYHILFAARRLESHRRRARAGGQCTLPKLGSGIEIEGSDSRIKAGAYEQKSSCGGQRTTQVDRSPFGQCAWQREIAQ